MKSHAAWTVALLALTVAPAFSEPPPPPAPLDAAKVAADLAKVPAKDPHVASAPKLLDAVKGKHPRLLFTTEEMAALKAAIPGDPILQKAHDGNNAWAKISLVPSGPRPPIVTNDTSALVKSYSQAPAMAYAYALDKDPAMKQKIVDTLKEMLAVPHWDDGKELDSNMGGACNMMMTALLFDTVYDELDPAFRTELAQKILTHARRMYYLGHKELCDDVIKYWQQDPQPNHRWYRDMGLAACVLAVADEKDVDASYLLQGLKEEMDFVMKWYPPDGDCHEGAGYQNFGITAIATACMMMDRNLGTDYLPKSGLKNAWAQQMYFWVPGRKSDISWGDDQNGPGGAYGHNDGSFFLSPRLSRDPLAQASLLMRMDKSNLPNAKGQPPILPWTVLAFYDPTVKPGNYKSVPLAKLFPDMGAASMRDSWEDNAVVFTFKCGPMGGYKLNEYRNTTKVNGQPHGINVAHDDPDANEFDLAVGNGFAFHPGVYSNPEKSSKITADHNTITVDGKGQAGEGYGFSQPIGNEDMTKFSWLTGWKTGDNGRIIIEGEAGPAYRGQTGLELKDAKNKLAAPVLKTYRRTAIWMPGDYILLLDNIAANGSHSIEWRGTAPKSQVDNGKGSVTTETGTEIAFQTVSNKDFKSAATTIGLNGRFGEVPVQQVQLTANTDAVKFATVLDPWGKKPEIKMSESGGTTTVTVHSAVGDDTWTWQEAKDLTTPSSVEGKRSGAALISLTSADKAPRE